MLRTSQQRPEVVRVAARRLGGTLQRVGRRLEDVGSGSPPPAATGRVRLAVISTPRSGNTWLRTLLRDSLGLQELAVHHPDHVPWDELPERLVLQLHWQPRPELRDLLEAHGFQVLSLSQHPLDVLVSIIHFCRHEPDTRYWLFGAGGNEDALLTAAPTDPAVVRYACGSRFAALLHVTAAWLPLADVHLRYENLVGDPEGLLRRGLTQLGQAVPDEELGRAVSERSFLRHAGTRSKQHNWQGRPGLWRELIPSDQAAQICDSIGYICDILGYGDVQPSPATDAQSSQTLWQVLAVPPG